MWWQICFPTFLFGLIATIFFVWVKRVLAEENQPINLLFFVGDAQEYFEGLLYDLIRFAKWNKKNLTVYVVNLENQGDTQLILERLAQKNYLQIITVTEAERYLNKKICKHSLTVYLDAESEVKSIRKELFASFTRETRKTKTGKELF